MYPAPFSLWLRNEDAAQEVYIPLSDEFAEALRIQWERCHSSEAYDGWVKRLRCAMSPAVSKTLDSDLRPPSQSQIALAIAIARQMDVPLPSRALRFQGAMQTFLTLHDPRLATDEGSSSSS